MAARTSTANGDWAAGTTWTGGTIPGNGDTATITHAVAVSTSVTVGHSPGEADATRAIELSGSGSLSIGAAGVLVVRGDVDLNGRSLTLAAGAVFEFDASLASAPSTTNYQMVGSSGSTIVCTGTSGTHCVIRSNPGGANGHFDGSEGGTVYRGLKPAITYTDFLRVGDDTNYAYGSWPNDSSDVLSVTHCTWTSCGRVGITWPGAAGISVTYQHNVHTSTASDYPFGWDISAAMTTGVRSFTHNDFDKPVILSGPKDATIEHNLFRGGISTSSTAVPASFKYNLIENPPDMGLNVTPRRVEQNYYLYDFDVTNPHAFGPAGDDGVTLDVVYQDNIFDITHAQEDGDLILGGDASAPCDFIVRRNIVLPNAGRTSPGKLVSPMTADEDLTWVIEHNTYCTTGNVETGGINFGEFAAGWAGMVSSFRSNLGFTPAGKTAGCHITRYSNYGVADLADPDYVDYNGGFGLMVGTDGRGYDSINDVALFSKAVGANDVNADPQFVDVTRNIKTWAAMKGSGATVADALALLRADPGLLYDLEDPTTLIPWVRAGFAPTNAVYLGTAHDAGDIGAVGYVGTGPAPTSGGGRLIGGGLVS
jgi:hypothetical protein